MNYLRDLLRGPYAETEIGFFGSALIVAFLACSPMIAIVLGMR